MYRGIYATLGVMYLVGIGVFVLGIYMLRKKRKREEQLGQYWQVYQGMPELEMLTIMGNDYSRSLLKNDRIKYEWRINGTSYGSSFKGISFRGYSGVKKVSIYVWHGHVEEVRTLNI